MNYGQAYVKAVADAKKTKQPYAVVHLSYFNRLVLPYDKALQLLGLLKDAEQCQSSVIEKGHILPLDLQDIQIHPMTENLYLRCKIAALLDLDVKEVAELETDHNDAEVT